MQNISRYFDSIEYVSQGSVFWPDIYKDHGERRTRRIPARFVQTTDRPTSSAALRMKRPMLSGGSSASHAEETGLKRRVRSCSTEPVTLDGIMPSCCSQIECKRRATFGSISVWGIRIRGDTHS